MRDSYVGDIGDFAKYGLLRAVGAGRRLGIAWYLCAGPEKAGTGDGRHVGYLRQPERWRHLDCELFDSLQRLVEEDSRSVVEVQSSGILGIAEFAGDPVDATGVAGRGSGRGRRQWFERVLDRLCGCDLVFADPDNGLCEDGKFKPERKENAKRIPLAEVAALAAGRAAIVYHHNGRRRGGQYLEIDDWMSRIPGCGLAYYWRRWSNRTFFIVNPDSELVCRVEQFAERWRGTGELVRAASGQRRPASALVSTAADNADEGGVPGADAMHRRVLEMLVGRYDRPIMNNLQRGDYVECMIGAALGADWRLTSEEGWDWAAWDIEHAASGARLEIKQSAARQTWDGESVRRRRNPSFDIGPRKGYWPKDGGPWVTGPGRPADVYIFAWHGEVDEGADHRDASQWRFFVVAERLLPTGQKSIGLSRLEKIAVRCSVAELGRAVERACPPRNNLRSARRRTVASP